MHNLCVKLPLHNIHVALTKKSKFRCTYFRTTNYHRSYVFIFSTSTRRTSGRSHGTFSHHPLPRKVQSVCHFFHDLPFRMLFYFLCLSPPDSFQTARTLWLIWLTRTGRNTKIRACTEIAELIHLWHSCIHEPRMIKKSFSKCPSLAWLCLKINCNLPIVQMNLHICYGKLRAQIFPFTSALSITVAKHSDQFLH